jgi:N-acetylneuraminic acid mutarotase
MSEFTSDATGAFSALKLFETSEPRGGASVTEVNGHFVVFGGADREQTHFNDLHVFKKGKWSSVEQQGDVPTPRSGHSTAAFGKFLFLYGGIDFSEEVAYNDLYLLDTGNFIIDWIQILDHSILFPFTVVTI